MQLVPYFFTFKSNQHVIDIQQNVIYKPEEDILSVRVASVTVSSSCWENGLAPSSSRVEQEAGSSNYRSPRREAQVIIGARGEIARLEFMPYGLKGFIRAEDHFTLSGQKIISFYQGRRSFHFIRAEDHFTSEKSAIRHRREERSSPSQQLLEIMAIN